MSSEVGVRPLAEDDVLRRARHGDAAAFTTLVDRHHADMLRVAYVICGDAELARDAAQLAWIKVWQGLPRLRQPERFRSWLVAIVGNEARQSVRARGRRGVRELPMPNDGHEPSASGPTTDGIDLASALARLEPADRELLAMRYLVGMGSEEIARATGRSASGVRARLSRLTSRLREELTDV